MSVRCVSAFVRGCRPPRDRARSRHRAILLACTALVAPFLAVASGNRAMAQTTGANGASGGFASYSAVSGSRGGSGGAGGAAGDGSAVVSGAGGTGGSNGAGGIHGAQGGSGPFGGAAGCLGLANCTGGSGGGSDSGGGSGGYNIGSGGGGGGGGGAGAALTGTLSNTTTITGGIGGDGSPGNGSFANSSSVGGAGGGGGGGSGVMVTTGTSITNSGTISGGNGGAGASGGGAGESFTNPYGDSTGGYGGNGITALNSSGLTIDNTGTIKGGNGGENYFYAAGYQTGGAGIIGQNLTITNSGTIAGGGPSAVGSAITITGGTNIIKALAGSNIGAIVLGGNTTLSGTFNNTVTVNGGVALSVTGATAADDATGITTFSNGGVVTIGAGRKLSAQTINNNAGTISIGASATLEGTGNTLYNVAVINVATNGTVTDAGAINNFSSGVINFNGPGGTATLASGANSIVNDGQIKVIGGNVAVTGDIINQANGIISLTGGNMTGIGTLTNGATATVNVTAGNNLGVQIFTSTAGGSVTGTGTITASNAFNLGAGSFTTVLAGTGALTKTGSGTAILTGGNTYTGGTTISGGTLQLGNGGTTGSIAGDVTNDGTLAFNRSDSLTFGSVISGTGSVQQIGVGTTILTAANNYSGGTTISAGTLQLGDGGTIGSITGDVTNNGTLAFNRSDSLTFGGTITGTGSVQQNGVGTTILTGTSNYSGGTTISAGTLQIGDGGTTGSIAGDVTNNAALAFNRSNSMTLAGAISGTGSVQQNGAGTTILSGTSNYSGGTTISAGTLQIGNGGTTGSIAGDVTNNAVLAFNRSNSMTFAGAISGTGSVQQNGIGTTILTAANNYSGGTTISAGTLQIGDGGTTGSIAGDVTNNAALAFNRSNGMTFAGAISGTGSVQQNGAGTTILTADNTYNGGTTISAGKLQIGDGGTIGSITGDVTNNAVLAFNRSNSLTFGGAITGTGSVQQNGAGTTILTGTSNYAGGTTISAGTLQIGDGGTTGSIAGDVTNNAVLAFNRSNSMTFGGAISGTGSVQQNGIGTTILTAANNYSGGTTISAGTLQIGDGGTTGSIAGDVTNNAVLAFNRSNSMTFAGAISGTGSVQQNGIGTTILTAANNYSGGTTISAGTLQIGDGGTIGSIAGDVTNNAALAFNRSEQHDVRGRDLGNRVGAAEWRRDDDPHRRPATMPVARRSAPACCRSAMAARSARSPAT